MYFYRTYGIHVKCGIHAAASQHSQRRSHETYTDQYLDCGLSASHLASLTPSDKNLKIGQRTCSWHCINMQSEMTLRHTFCIGICLNTSWFSVNLLHLSYKKGAYDEPMNSKPHGSITHRLFSLLQHRCSIREAWRDLVFVWRRFPVFVK